MIISKTPLRVSLFGGSSDIPEFYENNEYGAVISFAINKYVYIFLNKSSFDGYRISYRQNEEVKKLEDIQNTRVKACLKLFDIKEKLEIVTISDLPHKSGLGGSSAFTIGLLHALFLYRGIQPHWRELADLACKIEIENLQENIGKQDQFACAKGGLNYFTFQKDLVLDTTINSPALENIISSCFLWNIPDEHGHNAQEILNSFPKKDNKSIVFLRNIATEFLKKTITQQESLYTLFSNSLNESWQIKKSLSSLIDNSKIEEELKKISYVKAHKLLGAGGSGFLFIYRLAWDHKSLVQFPQYYPIKIDHKGSTAWQI